MERIAELREAFRHAGDGCIDPARAEIGDGTFVRIETSRGDPRLAAGDEKFTSAAADVDQRLLLRARPT